MELNKYTVNYEYIRYFVCFDNWRIFLNPKQIFEMVEKHYNQFCYI